MEKTGDGVTQAGFDASRRARIRALTPQGAPETGARAWWDATSMTMWVPRSGRWRRYDLIRALVLDRTEPRGRDVARFAGVALLAALELAITWWAVTHNSPFWPMSVALAALVVGFVSYMTRARWVRRDVEDGLDELAAADVGFDNEADAALTTFAMRYADAILFARGRYGRRSPMWWQHTLISGALFVAGVGFVAFLVVAVVTNGALGGN